MKTKLAVAATVGAVLFTGYAFAANQDGSASALPDACKSSAMTMDMGAAAGTSMDMTGAMDAAHQALMKGMGDMEKNMSQGMTAKDIDVAFVCGMIPHHQGAIDMAKAELTYGDDAWAKAMAQKVIDAQTQEIADMIDWLKKQ